MDGSDEGCREWLRHNWPSTARLPRSFCGSGEQLSASAGSSTNMSSSLVNSKYRITRRIGGGSFGEIYLGVGPSGEKVRECDIYYIGVDWKCFRPLSAFLLPYVLSRISLYMGSRWPWNLKDTVHVVHNYDMSIRYIGSFTTVMDSVLFTTSELKTTTMLWLWIYLVTMHYLCRTYSLFTYYHWSVCVGADSPPPPHTHTPLTSTCCLSL